MTGRECAVSEGIAVRFLLRVPTTTATDAKLGAAHVIDPSLEIPGWGFFSCGLDGRWQSRRMSTPHEIRDITELGAAYLQQDRTFSQLKSIMEEMHPWALCVFERNGESDVYCMTFTDRGHEINFSSDGCGSFFVKKSGETEWAVEVTNWDPIPIHEIISILTRIKRRLSDPTA